MSDTIMIREFQISDLEEVVLLHERCFHGDENESIYFGRGFIRSTYKFFLADAISFGFVALYEGKIVGFIVGRLSFYTRALNRYRMPAALWAMLTHPRLLLDNKLIRGSLKAVHDRLIRTAKKQRVESISPYLNGKVASLALLAVDPQYGKLRVSDLLVSAAEEFCRQKGMLCLRAGVLRSNIRSRFLHRKRGYVEDTFLSTHETLSYSLNLSVNNSARDTSLKPGCNR
jgi:ribosomal protein S18 acetylase RimI-like enzyme